MKLHASLFLLTPFLLPACVEPVADDAVPVISAADLPAAGTAHVWTPGGVLEVAYQREGDRVIFQDDMSVSVAEFTGAMVAPEDLEALAAGDTGLSRAAVRALGRYRWPGGVVPFRYEAGMTQPRRDEVDEAIEHWRANTPFEFVLRTNQADFVEFQTGDLTQAGCRADVGRLGGMQEVVVRNCSSDSIIHEIGHTVGFYHEQTRYDRDQFVTINWGNIQAGKESNFYRYVDYLDPRDGYLRDGADAGAYDYGSIMHYSRTAWSTGGETITPPAGVIIGQTNVLSEGDIDAAFRMVSPGGTYDDGPKVTLFRNASFGGTSQAFGLGYHSAIGGDFDVIGDNTTSSIAIPAGLAVEAWSGGVDDPRKIFGTNQATLAAPYDNSISAITVRRAVRVYRDPSQLGVAQSFTTGEWRANAGHLDVVGNDQISSIYVPPGLVAELCWSETGSGSTGSYCTTFDGGATASLPASLDNQTSLIRVKAAVTVYQEGNLWGHQQSLPIGTYGSGSFAPVANNAVSSLIVGDGLKVTLCDGASGGSPCELFRGDVNFVGGRMNDKTSWIKVEANTSP